MSSRHFVYFFRSISVRVVCVLTKFIHSFIYARIYRRRQLALLRHCALETLSLCDCTLCKSTITITITVLQTLGKLCAQVTGIFHCTRVKWTVFAQKRQTGERERLCVDRRLAHSILPTDNCVFFINTHNTDHRATVAAYELRCYTGISTRNVMYRFRSIQRILVDISNALCTLVLREKESL